jgi:putative acetyltransferase
MVTVAAMLIRAEKTDDHPGVRAVHRRAFGGDHGHVVADMTDALRAAFLPEPGLSLVAEDDDGQIVGHVMFHPGRLDAPPRQVEVAVLTPLGVVPERQRSGVGRALVRAGLAELTSRGVPLVFLEGIPDYYPKLGFDKAGEVGFRKPSLRIPDTAFMVYRLPGYADWMTGTLVYSQVLWDMDLVGLR